MRVFLTGGNGFVGGHVARALVAAGFQVVALVRTTTESRHFGSELGALADLPIEIVRGELAHPSAWAAALQGCAFCFHVAALYAGADRAAEMYRTNVSGTSALLAACATAGIRRVVHTSTIGTVGRPRNPWDLPDETVPFNLWDQASHYVRSKYLGELVARSWAAVGLEVVIVKPAAPVGAGDSRPSPTGRRILAALAGEVMPYPAGGVNHIPVADVAAGHVLAATLGMPGRTYILGHRDGNLDHAAFLRLVAEAAGRADPAPAVLGRCGTPSTCGVGQVFKIADDRLQTACPAVSGITEGGAGAPAALTAVPQRAIEELGLPQSDLRSAFGEAVAWYRESGHLHCTERPGSREPRCAGRRQP